MLQRSGECVIVPKYPLNNKKHHHSPISTIIMNDRHLNADLNNAKACRLICLLVQIIHYKCLQNQLVNLFNLSINLTNFYQHK